MQKRILAVHDLSCVGRCSMTIALPVLSAAGLEASALPTALLSTHTGGFDRPFYRDLSDSMEDITGCWLREGISFDGIYMGYLGSGETAARAGELVSRFPDAFFALDPAMADGGRLYSGLTEELLPRMRGLAARAQLLLPNVSEAALLTGLDYREPPHSDAYLTQLLDALSGLCPGDVILTGAAREDMLGCALREKGGQTRLLLRPRLPGSYHGAGDLFASALLGARFRGLELVEAAALAQELTRRAIAATPSGDRLGLRFEPELGWYAARLRELCGDMGLN